MNRISKLTYNEPLQYVNTYQHVVQQTPQMLFGTMLHAYLLENKQFNVVETIELNIDGSIKAAFVKKENININTTISGAWAEYFDKIKTSCDIAGYTKLFLNTETAMQYSFNVLNNSFNNTYNKAYYDKENLYITGHCDAFSKKYILDIKTTSEIIENVEKMKWKFVNSGYVEQLLLYREGLYLDNRCEKNAELLILAISNNINNPILQLYSISYDLQEYVKEKLINKLQKIHYYFNNPTFFLTNNIINL